MRSSSARPGGPAARATPQPSSRRARPTVSLASPPVPTIASRLRCMPRPRSEPRPRLPADDQPRSPAGHRAADATAAAVEWPGRRSPGRGRFRAMPAGGPLAPPAGSPSRRRSGAQSISLQAALYGAITSNPDLVTLRQQQHRLARGRRGRPAVPDHAQPDALDRHPADHPDPARPVRRHGPAAIDTARSTTRTVYYLPLAPPADRAGAPDDAPLRHRQGRATTSSSGPSSRPSCWPWCRPTASSRRPPIAARSSGWRGSSPTSTTGSCKTLERRLEANQVPAADVVLARGREPRRPASWSRSPGRTTPTP